MKERIIESVARLVNQYGVKRFTLDDIARDLCISKKTIYKYFSSKDQLISELISLSLEDNINSTLDAVEKEDTIIGKLNAALLSHHKFPLPLDVLEDIQRYYPGDWQRIEEQLSFKLKLAREIICKGVDSGRLRKNINVEVLCLMLESSVNAILDYKFLVDNDLNVNKALKEIEKILLYGIAE